MSRLSRLAVGLSIGLSTCGLAVAQAPPGGTAAGSGRNPAPGARTNAEGAAPQQRYLRRSIVHHYPYPYPGYYHSDQTAGFRNPGGVGRYLEYYPAGNQFQETNDPVRVARFDQGGGAPDRAEQLAAQQIGIQRENSIMNHIDNYARPAFGVGYFGGFY